MHRLIAPGTFTRSTLAAPNRRAAPADGGFGLTFNQQVGFGPVSECRALCAADVATGDGNAGGGGVGVGAGAGGCQSLNVSALVACNGNVINVVGTLNVASITVTNITATSATIVGVLNTCAGVNTTTIAGCNGSNVDVVSPLNVTSIVANGPATLCNGVQVRDISACGDAVRVNSPLNACATLNVLTVNGCGGGPVNVLSQLRACAELTVNNVRACDQGGGTINVNSPLNVAGQLRACTNLRVGNVTSCDSRLPINLVGAVVANGPLNVTGAFAATGAQASACNNFYVGNLGACSGAINVVSDVNIPASKLSSCVATMLSNVYACDGVNAIAVYSPINVTSPVTACGGVTTSSLTGCFGMPINVGSAIFSTAQSTGPIEACNGFSAATIGGCNGAPLQVTSDLGVSGALVAAGPVSACAGTSVGTLTGCNGAPISVDSPVTFSQTLTASGPGSGVNVCGGSLLANTVQACGPTLAVLSATTINAATPVAGNVNTLAVSVVAPTSSPSAAAPANDMVYFSQGAGYGDGANYANPTSLLRLDLPTNGTFYGNAMANFTRFTNGGSFTPDKSVFRVDVAGRIYSTPMIGTGATVEFAVQDAAPTGGQYGGAAGGGTFVVVSSATASKTDVADFPDVPLDAFATARLKTYRYVGAPADSPPRLGLMAEDLDADPLLRHAVARAASDGAVTGYSAHAVTTCLVGHAKTVGAAVDDLRRVARGHDHSIARIDAALAALVARLDPTSAA